MGLPLRFMDSIALLKRKVTKHLQEVEMICNLASTTRSFEYPDFFEPRAWLFKKNKGEARFAFSADLLAAWICHLSHGARRRMEIYEDAVLEALSNDRFAVAATLVRCHLETSAWVAYGLEELTKAAENASWSRLETLIAKMLNGTAVARETEHMPDATVDLLWIEPSSIMNAIDALDRYYGSCFGHRFREARVLYGVLSDYAHPTIFGIRHLLHAKEESSAGWMISYSSSEQPSEDDCGMILRTLLISMRLGHSAALMLRLGTIEDKDSGVTFIKPSLADGACVWEQIISVKPQDHGA